MSDLGWRADGLERARAVGGIELEIYRRPGFCAGLGVRRSEANAGGSGVPVDCEPQEPDPVPEDFHDG